jgi:hypothetical protein
MSLNSLKTFAKTLLCPTPKIILVRHFLLIFAYFEFHYLAKQLNTLKKICQIFQQKMVKSQKKL